MNSARKCIKHEIWCVTPLSSLPLPGTTLDFRCNSLRHSTAWFSDLWLASIYWKPAMLIHLSRSCSYLIIKICVFLLISNVGGAGSLTTICKGRLFIFAISDTSRHLFYFFFYWVSNWYQSIRYYVRKLHVVNEVNSPWLEMTDCGAKIGAFPNEDGCQSIQAHEKDAQGPEAHRTYSSVPPQHKEGLDT